MKLQEAYLKMAFGFDQAIWLYWSLIAISAGQILYTLFCPRIIKKYGSDRERHTIEALASMPDPELRTIRDRRIRAVYAPRKIRLTISPDSASLENDIQREVATSAAQLSFTIPKAAAAYKVFRVIADDGNKAGLVQLNFTRLNELFGVAPTLFVGQNSDKGIVAEFGTISQVLADGAKVEAGTPSDWKVNTLAWRYDHANASHPRLVWTIALLYVSGSVYFAWRTVVGLAFMVGLLMPQP